MDGPSTIVPPFEGGDVREYNHRIADLASSPPQPLTLNNGVADITSSPPQALPLNGPVSTDQKPLHEVPIEQTDKKQEHSGPLKQMVNPDSLYKYTNWEDPARTVGSYVGIMSILLGAHYLPLTQTALKVGATALGIATTVEYAHRSFTQNTILARMRPKEYKKIPEPVLNDTLKDIHDLVQYLVVEVQKIVLGQDLEKTFAGFIGLTALYWLVKMLSPFALVLLSITMLYIAPLVKTPRGREVIEDARVRAADLGNAALENSQALANEGKAKAAELSTRAQETAADAKRRATELAQSGTQSAADMSGQIKDRVSDLSGAAAENVNALPQMGKNAMNKAADSTNSALGNTTAKTQDTAADAKRRAGELVQSGSQSAANASNYAKDRTSDVSGTATENANALPQMGKNALNKASHSTNATLGNVNQQIQSALPERFQTGSQKGTESHHTSGKNTATENATEMLSHTSNTTNSINDDHTYGQVTSEREPPAYEDSLTSGTGFNRQKHTSSTIDADNSHYELKGTSNGLRDMTQSIPRHTAGPASSSLTDTMPGVVAEGDQAGTQGIMGRPRGVPLANLDGSPGFGKHLDTEL